MLPIGESRIELLEASGEDTPVGKFLSKRGPGIHHLCVEVDDINAKLIELKARGARLIDERPRIGAGGALVAFVHPSSTGGVLIELTQKGSGEWGMGRGGDKLRLPTPHSLLPTPSSFKETYCEEEAGFVYPACRWRCRRAIVQVAVQERLCRIEGRRPDGLCGSEIF